MSIFCWKGNWRESWQGQTTSGKPQHDLSFQNSSPLHSSLKQLQQLNKNTFSTFLSSRFMESRRARSFMTQLYPPFLALTRKSGVCSFFFRSIVDLREKMVLVTLLLPLLILLLTWKEEMVIALLGGWSTKTNRRAGGCGSGSQSGYLDIAHLRFS